MMKLPLGPNRLIMTPITSPSTPTAGVPHSWCKTGISAVMTVGGASACWLVNSDGVSGQGTFELQRHLPLPALPSEPHRQSLSGPPVLQQNRNVK